MTRGMGRMSSGGGRRVSSGGARVSSSGGARVSSGGASRGFSGRIGHSSTGSAGVSTPINSSNNRESNDSRTGECKNWIGCCFLCIMVGYVVAFLLCITKMKPRTRVALVWFYCILGGGLCVGFLSQHYQPETISASPTDMREVTGMSSVLCQSLSVKANGYITSYLFNKDPVVDTSKYFNYNYPTSTELYPNYYSYWGYFLLRASEVNIQVSLNSYDNMVHIYIIKNENNLNKWIKDSDCEDCYEQVYNVDGNSNFNYSVSDSDEYYFVFANNGQYIASMDIYFALERTRYNLADGSLICNNEIDCKIPLKLLSYVVFDVPSVSPFNVDVTFTCELRVYMYVILFGLLPIIVGTLITVCIIQHARKKELATRNRTHSQVCSVPVTDPEAGVNSISSPAARMPPAPTKYTEHLPSYGTQ